MSARKKSVLVLFAFWLSLAVFAEFIANDDPILYELDGNWRCAACMEWGSQYEHKVPANAKVLIPAILPYDANSLEPAGHILHPPLSKGSRGIHYLGTDSQSRDILAGIIYGARYALIIAFLSTLFAALVGILLGLLAGFYGNHTYKMPVWQLIIWILVMGYILFLYSQSLLSLVWFLLLMTAGLIWPFLVHQRKTKGIKLPLDTIITKLVEVVDSLPALFVLLAWAASIQNWTIVSLSLLIAFFRWPTFTRLSRIETNKWMKGDWINSLKALNMSDRWIIGRQLLDLIIIPLSIHAAFVAAAAISIEATLSFLGFGLGAEVVSWGALLNEARQYFQAWWLVVFPGLSLFSLLWAFNELAKKSQTYVKRSRLAPPDEVN